MNVEYLSMIGSSDKRKVIKMTLKDLSKVVGASTHIKICQRIEYDNVPLYMKSDSLSSNEFKGLVEKSDRIAYMIVECIFVRDNNLYICIY